MSTIVTRSGKGSPLTHNEVDTNFTNLNTDKVEKTAADITGGTINNTTVGATTPSTGVFTTLTGNSTSQFGRSSTNYVQIVGAATTVAPNISAQGGDTNIPLRLSSKNDATIYGVTNGVISFDTYAPSGSVNYLRLRGNATGVGAAVESFGSDSNVDIILSTKGTGALRTYTNGNQQLAVTNTASAVNYVQVTGGATTKGVIQSAQGSDSNISYVTQSKGTGAIDLAAGSSGVNISNGGTVTAITRTVLGGYTSVPSVALSAPTTADGVQATATCSVQTTSATIASGGTGYTVGDVITLVGGTPVSSAGTFRVATVSSGVITSVDTPSFSAYTTTPTNPVSVTGGTGSSATLNVSYFVGSFTITNAGSGYVEQPTVTFSGGGGSGAAAYATVGSGTVVKSIGATMDFTTPNGVGFRVFDSAQIASNYWTATGGTNAVFRTVGANQAYIDINGSVPLSIRTAVTSEQLRVSHTASAVNYVQVTGAATGASPTISAQGSDAIVSFAIRTKGTGSNITPQFDGSVYYQNLSAQNQFRIFNTASAVNYFQTSGSVAGVGLVLAAAGSDTNIPLVLQPKGTGALQAQQTDSTATGGNARGANAVDWQTSRTAASQVASLQNSVIVGGANNTASNVYAAALSGLSNTSSGVVATVSGGQSNTASGNYSAIAGGLGNTTAGSTSFIGGGQNNSAAGYFNNISGGWTNSGTSASAVTTQSGTMNATTAVTLSGSNANIKVGQYITGTSIASNTYVAAISGTSLTLSQAASGSSTSTLSFFTPHGVVVGGGNNQATGSYSFIGGGGDAGTAANRNVASGDYSAVVGGIKNTASGQSSFVGGGGITGGTVLPNTASGNAASTVGGFNNTSSGFGAFIGGGFNNISNGTYSAIMGGSYGSARAISGIHVSPASNNLFSTTGSSQSSLLLLAAQTTNATATVLTSDPTAAGTTNQVILPNNSAYYFKGSVIANVTGGGNTKAWSIEGAIKRGANAASTALVGTPTVTSAYADVGAATWAITATADTTNGGLAITFTGQASTTIRVVAKLETTEVTF